MLHKALIKLCSAEDDQNTTQLGIEWNITKSRMAAAMNQAEPENHEVLHQKVESGNTEARDETEGTKADLAEAKKVFILKSDWKFEDVKRPQSVSVILIHIFLPKVAELKQSLAWEVEKEAFSRAVRKNFGQFSKDRSMKLSKEQIRGLRIQVSEHGMNRKVRIIIEL